MSLIQALVCKLAIVAHPPQHLLCSPSYINVVLDSKYVSAMDPRWAPYVLKPEWFMDFEILPLCKPVERIKVGSDCLGPGFFFLGIPKQWLSLIKSYLLRNLAGPAIFLQLFLIDKKIYWINKGYTPTYVLRRLTEVRYHITFKNIFNCVTQLGNKICWMHKYLILDTLYDGGSISTHVRNKPPFFQFFFFYLST